MYPGPNGPSKYCLATSGRQRQAGHWLKFSTSNHVASVYTSRAHILPPVQGCRAVAARAYAARASIGLWRAGLKTVRAPIWAAAFIIRSYQGESTGSHPNSEVKHPWACSVLRWGTTWESQVTYVFGSARGRMGRSHNTQRASDSVSLSRFPKRHTFSAFWLRSSVVSVLISLISDTMVIDHPVD